MKSHTLTSGRTALTVVLLTLLDLSLGGAVWCKTAAGDANVRGWLTVESALKTTLRSGRPTVLVITSRTSPASLELLEAVKRSANSTLVGQLVSFAEMPLEQYTQQVDRMGVKTFPTVVVYGTDQATLKLLGHRTGPLDAPTMLAWLSSLPSGGTIAIAKLPATDPAVKRTASHDDGYPTPPSPQMPYPSSQNLPQPPPPAPPKMGFQPPPPMPQPMPVPYGGFQTAQVAPIYAVPMPQPVVVSTPATPVVVQPSSAANHHRAEPGAADHVRECAISPERFLSSARERPNAESATANLHGQLTAGKRAAARVYAPDDVSAPGDGPAADELCSDGHGSPADRQVPPAQSPFMAAALLTNPWLWDRLLGALGSISRNGGTAHSNVQLADDRAGSGEHGPRRRRPGAYAPMVQPAMMAMPAMARRCITHLPHMGTAWPPATDRLRATVLHRHNLTIRRPTPPRRNMVVRACRRPKAFRRCSSHNINRRPGRPRRAMAASSRTCSTINPRGQMRTTPVARPWNVQSSSKIV